MSLFLTFHGAARTVTGCCLEFAGKEMAKVLDRYAGPASRH